MSAPREVVELVERFSGNRESYRSGQYNETQLRREFLDPFFMALGWDVNNVKGYAEAYKDVIHEDAIKVGGATKAPDYCFRIGGVRKFFLEAKKPSISIKDEPSPAFQLRRYAWSAKLPLSILTDFEEFAVYDCRVKPIPSDGPAAARIMYRQYTEYPERWDEILSIFSPDAIQKGSFDKYVQTTKVKKGTAEVDDAFLEEIESWRDMLARNLALRNARLTPRELNFAVQRTIDRIIFLRICEDRGVENYGQLMALLNGDHVYQRLFVIFNHADERYNSGLFHFTQEKGRHEQPDELTHRLSIDDKPLKDIIRKLYYPESPYEFSVLPADILGQVYEQFLGKVIRLTEAHHAVVEEKPEVRKAGGVYYTPTYIVDYIIKNTVGKLLEGKTPKQAAKIRVLDPACGSGSFLIGAYQHLLNWHRDWYIADGPEKWAKGRSPALCKSPRGDWRLTTPERKRILLNNIYGVDIDTQAVEVTKLSLLLKVLEGENQQTLETQRRLFHDRALPDLGNNIKCGNSLIGHDYFAGQLAPDPEELRRVNPFDWNAEFPDIMKSGGPSTGSGHGFDAVIGNPPYIRVRVFKEIHPEQVDYLESHFRCATHVWDIYLLFFERALQLSREGGRFSFIVPIQTLHQPNCESLRRLLLSESSITSVADLSRLRVFQEAIVKNCILVCKRERRREAVIRTFSARSPQELLGPPSGEWPQKAVLENPGCSLKIDLLTPVKHLCDKLRNQSWQLDELCYVTFGLRSCARGKGQGGKDRFITTDRKTKNAKPYLEGRDIERYSLHPTGRYIQYMPDEMYSPRTPALFETKKIVSQSMLSKMRLVSTLDRQGYYVEQSLVCIVPHGVLTEQKPSASIPLEFILALMNSRLQSFYFATYIIDYSLGGGLIHATPGSQGRLIVPRVSDEKMRPAIMLVERMLSLHKQLAAARLPDEKEAIQRQIVATDGQIDRLVYELYGLTEDEIKIVEAASS